ncbi:MAG TPA: redoxin domain-containing protein [Armatimonadota bacterium]|nr:redoxin domain-containing protein [Armatimonadota bacterium]HOS43538.1 redoxin domain-containing protein [Armatimonadota bacterium]
MPAVNEPIRAPELSGGAWINSAPLSLAGLRGRAVLVFFWDYACVNCLRTLPYLSAWWAQYRDLGLAMVGVHSPQFPFSRHEAYAREAAARLQIAFPVLLDSARHTWDAWANRFWPTQYLVGPDGLIRYFHFGEGDYLGIEAQIQIMVKALHPEATLPPLLMPLRAGDEPGAVMAPATPDIYLGGGRGRLGNPEDARDDQVVTYAEHAPRMPEALYAVGRWMQTAEALRLAGETGALTVQYRARAVHAVLSPPEAGAGALDVEQDGEPLPAPAHGHDVAPAGAAARVTIAMPRAYHLVTNPDLGWHELRLRAATPGIAVYVINFIPDVAEEERPPGPPAAAR